MTDSSERLIPAGTIPTFCQQCGAKYSGSRPLHGVTLEHRMGGARIYDGYCEECRR